MVVSESDKQAVREIGLMLKYIRALLKTNPDKVTGAIRQKWGIQ